VNICLVSQFFPLDTGGGGIAAYSRYLARGLVQRGHRVFVVSKMGLHSRPISEDAGITVFRIPQWNFGYRATRIPIAGKHLRAIRNLAYSLVVRGQVERLAKQVPLDVVEYPDIEAEGFAHPSHLGIPYVVRLHTPHFVLEPFYTQRETGYDASFIKRMEKTAILRANAITSPSRVMAGLVSREYRLPLEWIRHIPNGIDPDEFSPGCSGMTNRPIVLFVGRLDHLKGADVFARAIPSIAKSDPDVQFVFLGADRPSGGGDSRRAELSAYLAEQGMADRVLFQDHADRQVFLDWYRRATVCVVPSLFENCPYALLEAMSCGKAVVASNGSGLAEIVEDGKSGLLFETGNSEALSSAVIRLLSAPQEQVAIGRAARQSVIANYSYQAVAELTERAYEGVLRKN
jgi:glycosyltransferase involved in cell wall biosynthesis